MKNDSPFHTRPTATGRDNQPARQGSVQKYSDEADPNPRASIQTAFPEPQHLNKTKVQAMGALAERASSAISLAVPTLVNSTPWMEHDTFWMEGIKPVSVKVAAQKATVLESRLSNAGNYLDSAEVAWDELCTVREQLHTALDRISIRHPTSNFQYKELLSNI